MGHAALLLIEHLATASDDDPDRDPQRWTSRAEVGAHIVELIALNARRWSKDLVGAPDRLARQVIDLLVELRLAEATDGPEGIDRDEGAEEVEVAGERVSAKMTQPIDADDEGTRFDVGGLDEVGGVDEVGGLDVGGLVDDDAADEDLDVADLDELDAARAVAPSTGSGAGAGARWIRLCPAAARFVAVESGADAEGAPDRAEQVGLW